MVSGLQDKLGDGEIIGVVLGSLLALCLCCCCCWWLFLLCCRRRRKREKKRPSNAKVVLVQTSVSSEVGIPIETGGGSAPLPPPTDRATEEIDLDAKRVILPTRALGRGTSASTAPTGRGTSAESVAIPQRTLTTREQHFDHV